MDWGLRTIYSDMIKSIVVTAYDGGDLPVHILDMRATELNVFL